MMTPPAPKSIEQKLAVMHAVWLCSFDAAAMRTVVRRAAQLLRVEPRELFQGFDGPGRTVWLDEIWHGRPPNWKPEDSLAKGPSKVRKVRARIIRKPRSERVYRGIPMGKLNEVGSTDVVFTLRPEAVVRPDGVAEAVNRVLAHAAAQSGQVGEDLVVFANASMFRLVAHAEFIRAIGAHPDIADATYRRGAQPAADASGW